MIAEHDGKPPSRAVSCISLPNGTLMGTGDHVYIQRGESPHLVPGDGWRGCDTVSLTSPRV